MKTFFFKLFLLVTLLVVGSGDLLAQSTWTKSLYNPLIVHGAPGSWNQSVTVPCVIFNSDSNRYEMWFTAFTGATPNPGIGFTYSSDGITWSSPTLVMPPGPASWESLFVGGVSVIKEGSLYKMWYTGFSPLQIGYATSTDGGITWEKYSGNPVLSPGTGWESGGVAYPSVIKVPGGYWMFYSGEVSGGITRTGRAFSTDGITWQKDTTHNPVLPVGVWDQNNFLARVVEINNILYMCYTGESVPGSNSTTAIGFATSADMGITWTKDAGNPIIVQGTPGSWDYGRIETGSILFKDDTLKIYYDGSGAATGNMGRVGLATAPCPLPLPNGTYTVGTGGNFATIQDAFDKLSTDGIAGNVTLELIDELYTAPSGQYGFSLNGPIPGAGPNSRVTIKPAENKNVVVEGSCEIVLCFNNTSYVTLDGVSIDGSTTLTVHNLNNVQFQFNDAISFLDNSDHNIVENCILISDGFLKGSSGILFFPVNSLTEAPDSNLIQNNFVKRAGVGIYVGGKDQNNRAFGNIIRGNKVGSEVDSLISWGIQDQNTRNSIIENNIVQNINRQFNIGYYAPGINTAYSSGTIIRNNVVHKVGSSNEWGSAGILVSGESWAMGNNNIVYNNMVYDIQCTSTNSLSRLTGIQIFNQINPKIYYNSVYLSGTGSNQLGSAAFYIRTGCTNVDAKNNIFVNARDESPYCASAIYDYGSTNLTSDYNDLYYDDTNNNNCLVRIGSTNYNTLADWQATGYDLHSYVEMPPFISSTNLHINDTIPTYLESRGIPIAGIDTDFDGDHRNADSTDIGADEFDGIYKITGVEDEIGIPTEYALEQNYPNPFNPSTTFRYSIPQTSKVVIKVYDILGNEIATLMDEEKSIGNYALTWNAENLPSGVYFYQLKAGSFVETKKMLLLK